MGVYITGDTHGRNDTDKLNYKRFPDSRSLTKKDIVIIAGDFGGVFYGGNKGQRILDWYNELPFTVCFVDGNHENFDLLKTYPTEMWHGGKVQRIHDSIYHLMRGEIYDIEGKSYFTFGGGLSIDACNRIPNISWWEEEEPSYAECEYALSNLEAHGNKVDYIITHAAPEFIVRNDLRQITHLYCMDCACEKFLNTVLDTVQYENWFCGHYHLDARIRSYNLDVLYQRIIKIAPGFPIATREPRR